MLRTDWVYSLTGRNFPLTMLRRIQDDGTVCVVSDQISTPTSAASVANAIWALGRHPVLHCIHGTDSGVASWYDFAVAIAEEATAGLVAQPAEIIPITTAECSTPGQTAALQRPRHAQVSWCHRHRAAKAAL